MKPNPEVKWNRTWTSNEENESTQGEEEVEGEENIGSGEKFAQNMHSSWNGCAFNLRYSLLKAIFG